MSNQPQKYIAREELLKDGTKRMLNSVSIYNSTYLEEAGHKAKRVHATCRIVVSLPACHLFYQKNIKSFSLWNNLISCSLSSTTKATARKTLPPFLSCFALFTFVICFFKAVILLILPRTSCTSLCRHVRQSIVETNRTQMHGECRPVATLAAMGFCKPAYLQLLSPG